MTSSFTTTTDDVICRHIQSPLFAQVKVNDYKAKLTKDAKQNKAKLSNANKQKSDSAVAVTPSASASSAAKPAAASTTMHSSKLGYFEQVQEDVRLVLKHLGKDFATFPALSIAKKNSKDEGGVQEPWSAQMAERALGNQNLYIAAGNLFWLDFLKSQAPGVPLRRQAVQQLGEFLWPASQVKPAFLVKLLEVEAPKGNMPTTPSGLSMLSPEGYAHAALYAAARDLPKHKDEWAIVLRSVPLAFVVLPDAQNDTWVYAWNARNIITQEFERLSRTAFQLSTEIALMKKRLEKDAGRTMSPSEVVQHLKLQGLKKASCDDELTGNFVSSACTIHAKFSTPLLIDPILSLEETYGAKSCLNSMTKLHILATKPLPACREFVVQGLFDWVSRGLIPNEEVTKSTVLGTSNACGLVQLFQLKKQCLDFWCSSMMARAKIVEADREILQRVLSNHESYRKEMLGEAVAWQGLLTRSSLDCLQFMEAGLATSYHLSCIFLVCVIMCAGKTIKCRYEF